jgi:hypothetical protein
MLQEKLTKLKTILTVDKTKTSSYNIVLAVVKSDSLVVVVSDTLVVVDSKSVVVELENVVESKSVVCAKDAVFLSTTCI